MNLIYNESTFINLVIVPTNIAIYPFLFPLLIIRKKTETKMYIV